MTDENYLQSAMLLDLVGQAPITINRAFVDLTGNVLAALWLSYAVEKGLDRCRIPYDHMVACETGAGGSGTNLSWPASAYCS